jgi:hypothetical protein
VFTPTQLEQLLAPIALYPDALLAQILMAATYPLEVVQAHRWRQDPSHASLAGDDLAAQLEPQPWDPSVKSLVPFPQILQMMDRHLEWTQALGDAFLAQEAQVMEAVQRLRQRAQAAGTLASTPEQLVVTQDQTISIAPASPQTVYVPVYHPDLAYGTWPYPAYPPALPYPPPAIVVGGPVISFGFGIGIVRPLWGWHHWDWHRRHIRIHPPRFHGIDPHRPPPRGDVWQHDPTHRRGVPYRDPPTRDRFPKDPPDVRRGFRGYEPAPPPRPAPAPGPPPQARPAPRPAPAPPPPSRPAPGPGAPRPGGGHVAPPPALPAAPLRALAPAFESLSRGANTRIESDRGRASRESIAPTAAPRAGPPASAPRSPAAPPGRPPASTRPPR